MLDDSEIERILVVTAHPDDLDFGAAGTIATWTEKGIEVVYCICTDGDAGGFDPAVPREDIPGIRQREQRAAAAAVGVTDVRFLGFKDGKLTASLELRKEISRVIRDVRPQRVVTQSAERNYLHIYASHPDHLAAGEAALCAVYPDARNPFAYPELLEEGFQDWAVAETWIMGGATKPNHHVDITKTFDRKVEALTSHESQMENIEDPAQRLRDFSSMFAQENGLPADSLVEVFQVIDTA